MLQALLLLTALTASAAEPPVILRHKDSAQFLEGGRGSDWTELFIYSTESHLHERFYAYITYNKAQKRITEVRLPNIRVAQKCELRRTSGGSIGDYKPKSLIAAIYLDLPYSSHIIWKDGAYGQDYNENPVVKSYDLSRMTVGPLSGPLKDRLDSVCYFSSDPFHHNSITVYWGISSWCRWKPENWHKPGNFPYEYALPANLYRTSVTVNCE